MTTKRLTPSELHAEIVLHRAQQRAEDAYCARLHDRLGPPPPVRRLTSQELHDELGLRRAQMAASGGEG